MRPARLTLAAIAAATMLATGCGGDSSTNDTGSEATKVTLTLNWYPYGEHAPFYYGVKQGIYAKHGIDLDIRAGQGSAKTAQAVAGGNTDFGWVDTPALMAAIEKGAPIKSIGVYLQTTPAAVQFFTDKGISSPKDLAGKSIAITPGDALTATLPAFLKANGMTESDVRLQNVDPAGKIAAVISGRADALVGFAHDQGPTIANKSGKKVEYLRYADYGVNFYSTGLVVNTATIKDHPDLVRNMVAATTESFDAATKDPEAAVASMKGVNPQLPPEPVLKQSWSETQKILHTEASKDLPYGVNVESDWQHTITTFAQAGLLKNPGSPSKYWDGSFAPKS